jgi:hypothetical protein
VLEYISSRALAYTRIFLGSAEAERDLEVMRDNFEKLESIQLTGFRAFHLASFAEACLRLGRRDDASAAIDEALSLSGGEAMLLGDLLRVKAALAESREEAVAYLERALAVTLRQGGRWLAVRVACELVERSDAGAERERATEKLREVYAELTEGFDLRDAQRARHCSARLPELVDELIGASADGCVEHVHVARVGGIAQHAALALEHEPGSDDFSLHDLRSSLPVLP